MVNLQKFYRNSKVRIAAYSPSLAYRIKKLFNQAITRLPNEEQFEITGTILIGPEELMTKMGVSISSTLRFPPNINLNTSNGNCAIWYHENLKDFYYLITRRIDNLDEKSDDYIKGLTAYNIAGWSYVWKTAREVWHEPGGFKEHVTILNQRIPPIRSEEYERNVDEETKRLGFAKELLAYDTQS